MTPRDETAMHRGLVASRVVEALCKGRGITVEDLARHVGMTRSTMYNRLHKGNWQFTELAAIAEALDEPISSFMDGLGGRFGGPDISPSSGGLTHRFLATPLAA